jgi:hypothetical protein
MADEQSSSSQTASPRQITSPWAVASLLCGVTFLPPLALFGILLGFRALLQIKADPTQRGRGVAIAGIILGALSQICLVLGLVWWHFNARIPMMHGPREELQAGMSGKVAAFKAEFHGRGASAPDHVSRTFLNELESRYGRLLDSQISASSPTKAPLAGSTELSISYTFIFARQTVEAEAVFITFAPTRVLPDPVFKWVSIRIIDPDRGDLAYPVQ